MGAHTLRGHTHATRPVPTARRGADRPVGRQGSTRRHDAAHPSELLAAAAAAAASEREHVSERT